jgi:cell division protein FtsW
MNNKTLGNIFKGDKVIWMVFFFLCMISIIEVYSASSSLTYKGGDFWAPMIKHIGTLIMGVFFMLVTINVPCKYFKVVTPFLLIFSVITLIWVLATGHSTNGAQRWVNLIGIQFQPSEIAKGTMVLAVAQILSALQTEKGAEKRAMKYILIVGFFIIPFIMLENLSTAMLLCITVLCMMLIGRVPMSQIGKLLGIVVLISLVSLSAIMVFGKNVQNKIQIAN